ncbi:hypothetical protein [Streptomyces laurentii]|uniref:hypothetical protein n=1 Tax=Streptomyces laurentii TaxID=39478 RepID=UPI003687856B
MINAHDVDWSAGHLPGQVCGVPGRLADLRSTDPLVRREAFEDFCAEAFLEGTVDPCTAASLPFLFDLADAPATPDRAEIVGLLFRIGREARRHDPGDVYWTVHGVESRAHVDINAEMPGRVDAFARYTTDADPLVRRPAIQAVGLFSTDGERATRLLAERLPAETGIAEQLLVVRTMASLADRLPETGHAVTAWLDDVVDGPARPHIGAPVRLAALAHRFLRDPGHDTAADTVSRALTLLRESTRLPTAEKQCDGCRRCRPTCCGRHDDFTVRPAHLAAEFFDPDHLWEEHSPISSALRTLHTALGDCVPERTDLLVAQLSSHDTATRYDAIAMAEDLPGPLPRPVLAGLLALLPDDWAASRMLVGGFGTSTGRFEVAPEDTALLTGALADHLAMLRVAHGPGVEASGNPLVRGSYQDAVVALADHRNPRARPEPMYGTEPPY